MAALHSIRVTRGAERPADDVSTDDDVVVEEPLEIRLSGETLAVTMRTPGHDRELVLGFLFAEGIIRSLEDVSAIAHCGRPNEEARGNTIEVTPAPGARLRLPEESMARRGTLTTSACGVCGRRSIDDLLERLSLAGGRGGEARGSAAVATMGREAMTRAVASLRERQPVFRRSGGCHAASLVTFEGEHLSTFEDVGRHNAVDKVVGAALLAKRVPAIDHALVVSGRTSFEIVQKAVVAGISVVISVSASSSLAVETARRAGCTLVGFARGGEFVVYAGDERIGR